MPTPLAVLALAAALAGALIAALQGAPWLCWAGLVLAAGPPLAFILRHARSDRAIEEHPVAVSIASGLGCVMGMVAVQRFGPDYDWTLLACLAALVVWMLWQRSRRRSSRSAPGA